MRDNNINIQINTIVCISGQNVKEGYGLLKCLFITSHTSVLIQLLFLDTSAITNEGIQTERICFLRSVVMQKTTNSGCNGGSIGEYDVTHANVITKRKIRWLKHLDRMPRSLIRKLLGS